MLVGSRWRPTERAEHSGLTGWWWRRQRASNVFDHLADGTDHASRGVEQAQLVPGCWPDLGQRGRVQTRVVRDDLLRLDTGRPQTLEERLDHTLVDLLGLGQQR